MNSGVLIPLALPWMVSPSVSDIRVAVTENDHCEILLDSACLPKDIYDGLENIKVRIRFINGVWVRTNPVLDNTILPPGLYDESKTYDLTKSSLESFRETWHSSGQCPSSSIYTVDNSKWLQESGAHRFNYTHYVIEGHDMWVEILAKGLEWQYAPDEPLGTHYNVDDL